MEILQPEPVQIQCEKRSPIQLPRISHPKRDKLQPQRLKLQALQGFLGQMESRRKKVRLIPILQNYATAAIADRI
jgi:hypothetical protein